MSHVTTRISSTFLLYSFVFWTLELDVTFVPHYDYELSFIIIKQQPLFFVYPKTEENIWSYESYTIAEITKIIIPLLRSEQAITLLATRPGLTLCEIVNFSY